jgi:hypothetical protein
VVLYTPALSKYKKPPQNGGRAYISRVERIGDYFFAGFAGAGSGSGAGAGAGSGAGGVVTTGCAGGGVAACFFSHPNKTTAAKMIGSRTVTKYFFTK